MLPLFKLFYVKVVFSYENTVKKILIKNSPSNDNSVVYRIPCKTCNSFYIGHTGKDLKSRIAQHKYSVRSGQQSNALFTHVSKYIPLIGQMLFPSLNVTIF